VRLPLSQLQPALVDGGKPRGHGSSLPGQVAWIDTLCGPVGCIQAVSSGRSSNSSIGTTPSQRSPPAPRRRSTNAETVGNPLSLPPFCWSITHSNSTSLRRRSPSLDYLLNPSPAQPSPAQHSPAQPSPAQPWLAFGRASTSTDSTVRE